MEIFNQCLLLVLGFFMLVKGAGWFVDGAAGVAERFGIPQLVIGLTIVAVGTSAPEAAVSMAAAVKGSADITIGNVMGSNILNIFMILGLTSVITAVEVAKSTVKYEIPYMVLVTGILLAFGYTGNEINRIEGGALWVLFLLFSIYLFKMSRENKEEVKEKNGKKSMWLLLILTITGLGLIVWGSDITVDSASSIAAALGFSERFIGLTIVALGTSLPELFTSASAALKGKSDIAIGNIVGSNIFNVLFVVGTTALITPVAFVSDFVADTVIVIAAGILLWFCIFRKNRLTRTDGVIMLSCYAGYFIYLLVSP